MGWLRSHHAVVEGRVVSSRSEDEAMKIRGRVPVCTIGCSNATKEYAESGISLTEERNTQVARQAG